MTLAISQFSERRGLLIHYLFRELFFNSPSEFHSLSFAKFYLNSLFILQIHYFFRKFTINSLFVSRTDFQRTIYFAYNIFHNLFHVLTLSSDHRGQISEKYPYYIDIHTTEFSTYFVNLSMIRYLFREFAMNSLSILRIHFQSTINFTNKQQFTFCFANPFSIQYICQNSLSILYLLHEFISQ